MRDQRVDVLCERLVDGVVQFERLFSEDVKVVEDFVDLGSVHFLEGREIVFKSV